ncbi:glycoside hydrolase family 43 protein [Galbibacter pacificus]|nr:glycoside hydrolase family 43 protein [Galbibacter pacificus]
MKLHKIIFLLFLFAAQVFGQKMEESQIYLADPTIFEDNGTYYLYGTKNDARIEGDGFLVYTSKDLKNWEGPAGINEGFALKKGDAFGTKGFWAPQVFRYKKTYYMAYTANENIAIATSDSPLGPFTNNKEAIEAPVRQIDPFIFFDDGIPYLYHVRLQEGNRIFVAEMTNDLKAIKPETLRECVHASADWEDTQNSDWKVTEGPTVLKKDKLYYLIYAANDFRNPDYAVGYATSKSPMGPWAKAKENPLISRENIGEFGSGHGDVVTNKNGDIYYVLHTHNSTFKVHPRKTAIVKIGFKGKKIMAYPDSFKWIKL